MRNVLKAALMITALSVIIGCTTLNLDAKGIDRTVSMTNVVGDDQPYRVLTQVEGKTRAIWLFGVRLSDADIRDILIEEAPGADAFVNVEITTKENFLDWMVSTVTQSVFSMRTVIITATAVEY